MKQILPISFFWTCLLWTGVVLAQSHVYLNYRLDDGLANDICYELFQDHQGYIWASTESGLSRFDGHGFRNYRREDGLPGNLVFGMVEDKKGQKWLRMGNGQPAMIRGQEVFSPDNSPMLAAAANPGKHIRQCHVDKAKNVWFGYADGGLVRIAADSSVSTYEDPTLDEPISVLRIFSTRGDSVIVMSVSRMYYWDSKLDSLITILNLRRGRSDVIAPLEDGRYLQYTHRLHGIILKKSLLDTGRLIKKTPPAVFVEAGENGNVWLGTRNGAFLIRPDGDSLKVLDTFLPGRTVTSILKDREQSLWFSTAEAGIFQLRNPAARAVTLKNGLRDLRINALGLDSKNNIWAGGANGSLYKLSRDSATFVRNVAPNVSGGISIRDFSSDRDFGFLAGGDFGMYAVERDHFFLRDVAVKSMIPDKDGKIYLASSAGLFPIRPDVRLGVNVKKIARMSNSKVFDAVQMHDSLWLGACMDGLYALEYDGQKRRLPQDETYNVGITAVEKAPDGSVWFGTEDGTLFVLKNDSVTDLSAKFGLVLREYTSISFEGDSIALLGGTGGFCIVRAPFPVTSATSATCYTMADGLVSGLVNDLLRRRDTIWIATNNGISILPLRSLEGSRPVRGLAITDWSVNGLSQPLLGPHELEYMENNVQIRFSEITFTGIGKTRYAYRLRGAEENWNVTSERNVNYPALQPGEYVFEVCFVSRFPFDNYVRQLPFTIVPPFWQQTWFYVLCVTLLFLGIVVVILITRQLIRRKAALDLQIAEAKQSALHAQMNPHFVFNALNSIQKFVLKNDSEKAYRYLEKFSKLIRKVLEHSRARRVPLADELEALELYIELEALRFRNEFQSEITVDPRILPGTRIPPMLIQPFVENAIRHGLVPKVSGGEKKLLIHLEKMADGRLRCIVEDNGIGRAASRTLRKKSMLNRASVGMSITADRLRQMTGNAAEQARVEIKDLCDSDGMASGTRITLQIPTNDRK